MESFLRKILEQDIKDNSMTKDKKKKKDNSMSIL